jgi:hypothetical protein
MQKTVLRIKRVRQTSYEQEFMLVLYLSILCICQPWGYLNRQKHGMFMILYQKPYAPYLTIYFN